jgi:beta-phosphoglucomutase
MTRALQAIILDFDGVIANSEPLHLKAFQTVLEEEGIALSAGDYYSRYLGFDDVGVFRAIAAELGLPGGDDWVGTLVERKGARLQTLAKGGNVLFPGAAAFVQTAATEEIPLAIASGALRHEILEVLEAGGLGHFFTAIVAAGDTSESKPSPAPYQLAYERLCQVSPRALDRRRCVAVEDSRWGLESAMRAGLRCVGVTNSYPAEALEGAELVVPGLHELTLPALDRLCTFDAHRPR